MNMEDKHTDDLSYVLGCLCFCADTLLKLGHRELAEEITRACAELTPMVVRPRPTERREAVH